MSQKPFVEWDDAQETEPHYPILGFEIRKCEFSLLSFKIVLDIPGPLLISMKKSAGILTGIALNHTSLFWVRTVPISLSTRVEPKDLLPA